jgi:hypothetical protein
MSKLGYLEKSARLLFVNNEGSRLSLVSEGLNSLVTVTVDENLGIT